MAAIFTQRLCVYNNIILILKFYINLTKVGIAKEIKKALSNLSLEIQNVQGQGYDGARNMSGFNRGV